MMTIPSPLSMLLGFFLMYAFIHFLTTAFVMVKIAGFHRQLMIKHDIVSLVAPTLKMMNTIIPGFVSDRVEVRVEGYVIYTRTDHNLIELYQDEVIGALGRQITISYDIAGCGIIHVPRIYKTEELAGMTFYEEVFIGMDVNPDGERVEK